LKHLIIIFSPNKLQEQYMVKGKKRVYGLIMCSLVSLKYFIESYFIDYESFIFRDQGFVW
jgi:hypothetical protein